MWQLLLLCEGRFVETWCFFLALHMLIHESSGLYPWVWFNLIPPIGSRRSLWGFLCLQSCKGNTLWWRNPTIFAQQWYWSIFNFNIFILYYRNYFCFCFKQTIYYLQIVILLYWQYSILRERHAKNLSMKVPVAGLVKLVKVRRLGSSD